MLIKRIKGRVAQIYWNRLIPSYYNYEERWLGDLIIKNSRYAAPDFMIIGAARAGTTSLFQYLAQHPDVVPSTNKEVKYFGMRGRKRGIRWYLNHFPNKEELGGKITFEATPTYIYRGATSAKHLAQILPDVKCILSLRDPVERAFSHWTRYQNHSKFYTRSFLDERPFSQAVQEEINDPESVFGPHKYLERGLYARQLKDWDHYFSPGQILILDYADLKNNPKAYLKDITTFLNIRNVYKNFNPSQQKLEGIINKKDANEDKEIKMYNANVYHKKEINKETERLLREYYAKPDEELRRLTGRTFQWMK